MASVPLVLTKPGGWLPGSSVLGGGPVHTASATISGGVISVSSDTSYAVLKITVDTEGGASTDDLDTINGGHDGAVLILVDTNSSRDVTVKNGTGNLVLETDEDFKMTDTSHVLVLYNEGGTTWREVSRSRNTVNTFLNQTISSGAITITAGHLDPRSVGVVTVDTEGAAATDTLDTINGGVRGQVIILRTSADGRDVTVISSGSISVVGEMVLRTTVDTILLWCNGANDWRELSRANTVAGGNRFIGFFTGAPSAQCGGDQYCEISTGHIWEWDGSAWNDTGNWMTVF